MKPARILLWAVLAGSLTLEAEAGIVRLELELTKSPPMATKPLTVRLRAEPKALGGSSSDAGKSSTFEARTPGEMEFDLEPGLWVLTVESEGLWAAPTTLEVSGERIVEKLDLWPTGKLQASVVSAEDGGSPAELTVRFGSSAPGRQEPAGIAECAIVEELWSCHVPAATLDLRFQSAGFVPHYLWDVKIPSGGTRSLEKMRFQRGAAVIGWVTSEARDGVDGTEVHLAPRSVVRDRDPASARRIDRMGLAAVTNDRGFFQIHGVPPGEYVLEARKKPFAPSRVSVRVLRDRVTEVTDPPLMLRKPQAVEIFVDPPLAPNGERWQVRLTEIDRGSSAVASQQALELSESGAGTFENLPPARYLLALGPSGHDERWYQDEFEIEEAQPPLFVNLPVTEVRGSVSFGDDPIAAELFFGRQNGPVTVALTSDPEGRFEGYLPRDGSWELDVVSEEPPIRRSLQDVEVVKRSGKPYAELELRLPNTVLEGIVVNEASILAPQATVTIQSLDEVVAAVRITSDDAGEFEVLGLPPGLTSAIAEDARGQQMLYSQEARVELADDGTPSRIRLVLRPELRIKGRVVDGDRGVPGARIKAEPLDVQGLPLFPETSDPQGFFEVHLPSHTHEFVLSVGAPGFAFRFFRVPAAVEEPLIVPVSQASGTLRIQLPEDLDRTSWSAPHVYLHHGGATESLGYLLGWARFNDQLPADDRWIQLPRMEPGDYVACLVPFSERFATLETARQDHRCAGGYLAAAGELELSFDGGG